MHRLVVNTIHHIWYCFCSILQFKQCKWCL